MRDRGARVSFLIRPKPGLELRVVTVESDLFLSVGAQNGLLLVRDRQDLARLSVISVSDN